jgi:hypothetical protein
VQKRLKIMMVGRGDEKLEKGTTTIMKVKRWK